MKKQELNWDSEIIVSSTKGRETLSSMAAASLRAEMASRSATSLSVLGSEPASIQSAISATLPPVFHRKRKD